MNSGRSSSRGIQRLGHGRARPGSSRWFRRYRWLVIAGWLFFLLLLGWVLFFRTDTVPLASPVSVPAERVETSAVDPGRMPPVKLPADDGAHDKLTEWWYYSGHLQSDSGERYSFHVASFLRQGTLTHAVFQGSLLDHQTEKLYTEQARTAGNPGSGRRNGFDLTFGNWRLQGEQAQHAVKMAGKDFSLDLKMTDRLPPVLHQAPGTPVEGLLDFGSAGLSYYTSRPRMSAQGTLTTAGTTKAVRGEVWFDHQWGDFEAAKLRWNWFALQMNDGADLMIFELFDRQGATVLRMGTYAKDGIVSALGAADFVASTRNNWKSPASGVTYPINWTISVPSKGLKLQVDPVIRASEFDARTTTLNVYWEGAVKLSGSQRGVGFMELSGY